MPRFAWSAMAPPARQTKSPGWAVITRPVFVMLIPASFRRHEPALRRIGDSVEERPRRAQEPRLLHNRTRGGSADRERHGELAVGCSTTTVRSRPSGICATSLAGDPGRAAAVATVTAAKTPMEAWHSWGMKLRVAMAPPAPGAETRQIFGTAFFETSPSFMSGPALSLIASMRAFSSASLSSWSRGSWPVRPTSAAFMTITGMPLSIRVQRTPSTTSTTFPVGSSAPQTEPSASRKVTVIGAEVPGAPSMRAPPS